MIRNGWSLSDGKAIWIAQTEPDPMGRAHTIMVTVEHREFPDPRAGKLLKLMLDGEPQGTVPLGGDMDQTMREFAELNCPKAVTESAIERIISRKNQRVRE